MSKKAIVLLSGGMDSATCLWLAKQQGFAVYALSFSYGQRHDVELHAAKNLATEVAASSHRILNLDLPDASGSSLTNSEILPPDYKAQEKAAKTSEISIPNTYVPARNTIFLAYALSWAEAIAAEVIYIGASAIDYSGYPDCRPEYFAAWQRLLSLATAATTSGKHIEIRTPLLHLSKAETIVLGESLGLDYAKTISCYRSNQQGQACGSCDSCMLRARGFKEAGVKDNTRYVVA
jgi:7-cyano-7-deazaguanine synthase